MARNIGLVVAEIHRFMGSLAARKALLHSGKGDVLEAKHSSGVEVDPVANGSKGGKARAQQMTPAQRSEVARKAADARWGRTAETAEYIGNLQIADTALDCVVLPDGRRVISQGSIMSSLGRSESSGRRTRNDNRPPFVEAGNLVPYFSPELVTKFERVEYRLPGSNGIRQGYEAEILPLVCEAYLAAREEGVLTPPQLRTAQAAEVLVRGLARVGIIALVDEATGYQAKRAKDELALILEQYVSEEFRQWVKRFPETFFQELYKIHGWDFRPGNHRHSGYVGQFINRYVYEALPPGILEGLREANPTTAPGRRTRKLHQHLTEDIGVSHLEEQIKQTITLMKASQNKDEFNTLFRRLHPVQSGQDELPIEIG